MTSALTDEPSDAAPDEAVAHETNPDETTACNDAYESHIRLEVSYMRLEVLKLAHEFALHRYKGERRSDEVVARAMAYLAFVTNGQ